MTAEIDRRHIKIINDLIAYQRPLTSSFLASSLGLSDKTTRKLLSELSPVLAENGAELTAKAGSGYQITVLNNELFQKFHKQIHEGTLQRPVCLQADDLLKILERLIDISGPIGSQA